MSALPLPCRLRYWRSLLNRAAPCKGTLENQLLLSGHAEELRMALRDAIHEIENLKEDTQKGEQKTQRANRELAKVRQGFDAVITDVNRNKQTGEKS